MTLAIPQGQEPSPEMRDALMRQGAIYTAMDIARSKGGSIEAAKVLADATMIYRFMAGVEVAMPAPKLSVIGGDANG